MTQITNSSDCKINNQEKLNLTLQQVLDLAAKEHIEAALARFKGRADISAKALGVGLRTFARLRYRLGVDRKIYR